MIKLIAGEQFNDQEDYNRVVVKKVNLNNQLASQSVYASSKVNFYYPLLAVSDTAVLICAFTEAESNAVRGKNSNPYMFFVKLDTNLAKRNAGPVLLKSNKRFKDETFLPRSISAFGNGYCIISVGQYQDPYAYERTNSSLRFTMIDNKNNLVKDTVIADKRGRERFQWNNFFTIPSDNGIDFFCARQDDLYKSGIIHLSIDSSGNIKEQNMVVNGHYDYLLPESKKLSPGVLLIPFIHNGNTALMKLDYR